MAYRSSSLSFILLLNVFMLDAQGSFPTAPKNPVWQVLDHFLQENLLNQDVWYTNTSIESCGTSWTPILVQREYYPFPLQRGYYRTSGEQVYFRKTLDCSQSEYLLYDFSVSVGDSIRIYDESALSDNRITYHVMETGTRCYGGVERRYLSVGYEIGDPSDVFSYYDFYQTVWVEGIGDLTHPFKGLDCVSSVDDVCENYVYVECLNTDGGVLYSRDQTSDCSYDLSHLTRIYVDIDQVNTWQQDGSKWSQAFNHLQDALVIADYGDTIWVAEGTYLPTLTEERDASFFLKNGVRIFGGFTGNELALEQRDWVLHPTLLSGEIGDTSIFSDNSFHVLYAIGCDSTTLLDGFTITRGWADENPLNNGINWRGGGALLDTSSDFPVTTPSFRNCHFLQNHARTYGGAIYCQGTDEFLSIPRFEGCLFTQNDAYFGGAIYKTGSSWPEQPMVFSQCDFIDNDAIEVGSVFLENASQKFRFTQCRFIRDSSLLGSGGIQMYGSGTLTALVIEGCDFTENEGAFGGAIATNSNIETTDFQVSISNSNFVDNNAWNAEGGAILLVNDLDTLLVDIDNSQFVNNSSISTAGALSIENGQGAVTKLVVNQSYFNDNRGGFPGGGAISLITRFGPDPSFFQGEINNSIFYQNLGLWAMSPGENGQLSLTMRHCTTYENGDFIFAKAQGNGLDNQNTTAYLENNIIWEPSLSLQRIFYNGSIDVDHIYGYTLKNNLISAPDCYAEGCEASDLGGNLYLTLPASPLFQAPTQEDFSLRACSPAINAGYTEGTLLANLQEDYGSNTRIQELFVDMGAFERVQFQLIDFATIINSTGETATDGSIMIDSILGGTPPFVLQWDDGSNSATRSNLPPDSYMLTVTDAENCSQVFIYEVDVMVGAEEYLEDNEAFVLFPNPIRQNQQLKIQYSESVTTVMIYSFSGNLSWAGTPFDLENSPLALPKGVYLVNIRDSKGLQKWQKLVVY